MKIHLGCGNRYINGWYHVDVMRYPHVNLVSDVKSMPELGDGIAMVIYASHVLEHFTFEDAQLALREWHRILGPGGILRLSVPDFAEWARRYLYAYDVAEVEGSIVGGQKHRYDDHRSLWDRFRLERELLSAGFRIVRPWDWRATEHSHVDDFSQAYLPHGDTEHGVLMSLNLEGLKNAPV